MMAGSGGQGIWGAGLGDRLLRGGAWALAGRLGTSVSMLVLTVILARLLDVGEMGAFFLAMSLAQGLAVVARLGLDQAALRLVASELGLSRPARARAVIRRVLRLGLVCGAVAAGVLLWGGDRAALRLFDAPHLAEVMLPFGLFVGVLTLRGVVAEVFRAFHDIRSASLFNGLLTAALCVVVFAGIAWTRGSATLEEVLGLYFLAACLSVGVGLVLLRGRVARMEPSLRVQGPGLWSVAGPLWVAGVMRLIQTGADVWILAAFAREADVALYVASLQLVTLVGVPLVIANAVLPSTIADLYERGEKGRLEVVLRRTASLAALPAFVVLPVLALFGGPVLSVVYGPDYAAGWTLLSLLALGYLIQLATGSCGRTLAMTGNQAALMKITAVTGTVIIVALLAVAPVHGALGVAAVASVGRAAQNLAVWSACKRTTGLATHVSLRHLWRLATVELAWPRSMVKPTGLSGSA